MLNSSVNYYIEFSFYPNNLIMTMHFYSSRIVNKNMELKQETGLFNRNVLSNLIGFENLYMPTDKTS